MALRYDIDAFTDTCALASETHVRCASSTGEARGLSREVDGLSIVLEEIKSYWNEYGLTKDQTNSLAGQASSCEKSFRDIGVLLDEKQTLDSVEHKGQKPTNDVGRLRNWIILQAMQLATLYHHLTIKLVPDAEAKQHAQLLEVLNTIHVQHSLCQRRTTALSQVTYDGMSRDDMQHLQNSIVAEIESEHVDRKIIEGNWRFVKDWIFRVMAEDDGESDNYTQDDESSHPGTISDIPQSRDITTVSSYNQLSTPNDWSKAMFASVTDITEQQPRSKATVVYLERALNTARPEQAPSGPLTNQTQQVYHLQRTPSYGSHRSQASDWRPTATPNPPYVEALLIKLLAADGANKRDTKNTEFIAKRVFYQLDVRQRSRLDYAIVESRCWNSVKANESNFDKSIVMRLIQAADVDEDNMLDLREFTVFLKSLVVSVDAFRETMFIERMDIDSQRGIDLIQSYLSGNKKNLEWGWAPVNESWEFRYKDRTLLKTKTVPRAAPNTFVNMELIARSLCSHILNERSETWFEKPTALSESDSAELLAPIYAVVDVAAQFSKFLRQEFADLDKYETIIDLILHCQQDDDPKKHPVLVLQRWKDACYQLLQLLVGFVIVVDQDMVRHYHNRPPPLDHWRSLRMKDRAEYIEKRASIFVEMHSQLDDIRKWVNGHHHIADDAAAAVERAFDIQRSQVSSEREEIDQGVPVEISIVGLRARAKWLVMGTDQCSATLSKVSPTDSTFIHRITNRDGLSNSSWTDSFNCDVFAEDVYKIDITSTRRSWGRPLGVGPTQLHTRFTMNEADISSMERTHKVLDLTGLGKGSKATIILAITPKRAVRTQPRPDFQTFSNFKDLVKAIKDRPLPPEWQMKTTVDGKTYFESSVIDVPSPEFARSFDTHALRSPFMPITPPATAREIVTRTAACRLS